MYLDVCIELNWCANSTWICAGQTLGYLYRQCNVFCLIDVIQTNVNVYVSTEYMSLHLYMPISPQDVLQYIQIVFCSIKDMSSYLNKCYFIL